MKVLSLEQAGIFAWSNSKRNKSLFATASVYDSFSSSEDYQSQATLQLYSLEIVNRTSSSQKLGTATIEGFQFTSLDWHPFGDDGTYPYGLIASGFNEGSVGIWDANTIIQNNTGEFENSEKGLICLQNVHSCPVQTVGFNHSKKHLLASGGVEVAIHNIEKDIADPDVFSPGANLHEGSVITSVSWNRHVPHILGSASQNGVSVVWDLKINKSIFNFSDQTRNVNNRNVSLSWNPEVPTQIAVVYDDPKVPELQMWDLRNPKGPVFCTAKGHSKGIHYLDWCLTDPSLIITLGRDNKICIWNYKTGDNNNLVSEFTLDEPCTSVQWSPREPEIYAVTSATESSTVYSLNNQLDHIPIWLRPPVGARFSFDSRLVVFSDKAGPTVKEYDISPTKDKLLPYILDFEQNFSSPNVDIRSLCDNRIFSPLLSNEEKEEWKFIKAIVDNNTEDIFRVVGIDKDKAIKHAEEYTNKTYAKKDAGYKNLDSHLRVPSQQEAEALFNALAEQGMQSSSKKSFHIEGENVGNEVMVTETITKNSNWNAGIEKIIKENILIGNIEGAVDAALKCGRVAEALLLAYSKGEDFFRTTIDSYVTSSNDMFVKTVIRYLVEDEISELVQKYALEDWKECVALCASLSNGVDKAFRRHMDELASRLSRVNNHNTALLCYILSKNFLRILETFAFRTEGYEKGSFDHTIFLMRTIEKLIALKIVTDNLEPNSIVDRFIYELTKVLHAYKRDQLILNLLEINSSVGFECLILRDRILGSSPEFSQVYPAQNFPFHQELLQIKQRKPQTAAHTELGTKRQPNQPQPVHHNQQPMKIPQTQHQTHLQGQTETTPLRPIGFKPGLDAKPLGTHPPAFVPGQQSTPNLTHKPETKSFPPPAGAFGGPKTGATPFNPGVRKEEIPPPISHNKPLAKDPSSSFPSSVQTSFIKKENTEHSDENFPMLRQGELDDTNRSGVRTPSSVSNSQVIHHVTQPFLQQTFNEPSPTTFKSQPHLGQPHPGQPHPAGPKTQPPGFKAPALPKPLTMSVKTPQSTAMPTNSTTLTQVNTSMSGPLGNTISGPSPTLKGGPPLKGPIMNPPKPGFVNNPPPQIRNPAFPANTVGPGAPLGGIATGGMAGDLTSNIISNKSTGGPPLEGAMQAQPQAFKPQPGPGKGPVKMPPQKMPVTQSSASGHTDLIDASQIPSNCQSIYNTVTREIAILEQIDGKKTDLENKMNHLFKILAEGSMKSSTLQDLLLLCQNIDQQNFEAAMGLQQKIAKEDFVPNKDWLMGMRRIIQRK